MHGTSTAPVSWTSSEAVFLWTLPWQLTNDKKVHSTGFYRHPDCPKFRLLEAVIAELTLAARAPNPWPLLVNMKWGRDRRKGDPQEWRMCTAVANGPLTHWGVLWGKADQFVKCEVLEELPIYFPSSILSLYVTSAASVSPCLKLLPHLAKKPNTQKHLRRGTHLSVPTKTSSSLYQTSAYEGKYFSTSHGRIVPSTGHQLRKKCYFSSIMRLF